MCFATVCMMLLFERDYKRQLFYCRVYFVRCNSYSTLHFRVLFTEVQLYAFIVIGTQYSGCIFVTAFLYRAIVIAILRHVFMSIYLLRSW
jgi:hypothetical protein